MNRVLSQKSRLLVYFPTCLLFFYLKSTAGSAAAKASATKTTSAEAATTEASAKTTAASAASRWENEWGNAASART